MNSEIKQMKLHKFLIRLYQIIFKLSIEKCLTKSFDYDILNERDETGLFFVPKKLKIIKTIGGGNCESKNHTGMYRM